MKEPNTDAAIAADFGRYDKACTQAENEFEAERAAGRAPCACGCGLYEDEDDMVGFGLARDELELYIVAHLMEAERKREQAAAPATEAAAHIERLLTRVNAALAAAYREGGAAMNGYSDLIIKGVAMTEQEVELIIGKLREAESMVLSALMDDRKRDSWRALDECKVLIWKAMDQAGDAAR